MNFFRHFTLEKTRLYLPAERLSCLYIQWCAYMDFFSFNKLLFANNTASYITYTTNTYTTTITIHLRIQLKIQTQLLHIACNRPFARSGHMVQNHTCWWASCTVGLPKQCNSYQSTWTCLCFGSPTAQLAHQYVWFCTMWPDRAKGLYL